MSDKFTIQQTGIQFNEDLTLQEWEHLGGKLGQLGRCVGFLIGDWLTYGEGKGERYYTPRGEDRDDIPNIYSRAMEITGLDYNTLSAYASTSKRVKFCLRKQNLSFEVHKRIAPLKSDDDQRKWLEIAEKEKMSSRRLARSIEAGKPLSREDIISTPPALRGVITLPFLVNRMDAWLRDRIGKPYSARQAEIWLQDLGPILEMARHLRERASEAKGDYFRGP
jgi:hypothetical protein